MLAGTARTLLGVGELLLISVVMQIGLALPMAYYFHRATVVGLPANMLVVPLMELLDAGRRSQPWRWVMFRMPWPGFRC